MRAMTDDCFCAHVRVCVRVATNLAWLLQLWLRQRCLHDRRNARRQLFCGRGQGTNIGWIETGRKCSESGGARALAQPSASLIAQTRPNQRHMPHQPTGLLGGHTESVGLVLDPVRLHTRHLSVHGIPLPPLHGHGQGRTAGAGLWLGRAQGKGLRSQVRAACANPAFTFHSSVPSAP